MKKKILVTGGTGYIGSHTSVELIEEGFDVVIIDNLYNSEAEVVDRIEKITGIRPALEIFDLCDKEKLDRFLYKATMIYQQLFILLPIKQSENRSINHLSITGIIWSPYESS